jgi:hypothetical protein
MNTENIVISPKNVKGKCDLKCSYNFKYQETSINATNKGVMISLMFDSTSTPSVTYNNQKYDAVGAFITCPSIHKFHDKNVPAELSIMHNPVTGGNPLRVSIPIKLSSETSDASSYLTEIINKVSTSAPAAGESTNVNISGFTLQKVVPNKPFYSYSNKEMDCIVFSLIDSIPLNTSTLTSLKEIIKPFPIPTPGNGLFFNSSGPNTGMKIGNNFYLKCNPTGASTEETEVETTKENTSAINFGDIINSPTGKLIIQIIVICLLFGAIFYGINYAYKWYTTGETAPPAIKIPTFSKPNFLKTSTN